MHEYFGGEDHADRLSVLSIQESIP